jgi:hypothetical protein
LNNVTSSHSVHVRMRITHKDLDRPSERVGQLDTINTNFIEMIWEGLVWVCLAQDAEP